MNKDIDFRTLVPDNYRHQGPIAFNDAQYTATSRVYDNLPLFWQGGDLGMLAVSDMANRLLRRGATPRHFAATLTIDTDTPASVLHRLRESMRTALIEAEMECVSIHTSLTTSGTRYGVAMSAFALGQLPPDLDIGASCIEPGDIVLISGQVGAHAAAIEIAAQGIPEPMPDIVDRPASLGDMVHALLRDAPGIRAMLLPTRPTGLIGALRRAAERSYAAVNIDRNLVPVDTAVADYCADCGKDPLAMATAGVLVAIVPRTQTRAALDSIRRTPYGNMATAIGTIEELPAGEVIIN